MSSSGSTFSLSLLIPLPLPRERPLEPLPRPRERGAGVDIDPFRPSLLGARVISTTTVEILPRPRDRRGLPPLPRRTARVGVGTDIGGSVLAEIFTNF